MGNYTAFIERCGHERLLGFLPLRGTLFEANSGEKYQTQIP